MSKNSMCNGAERKHGGESDRAVLIPPNETGYQPAIDNTAVGNTDPVTQTSKDSLRPLEKRLWMLMSLARDLKRSMNSFKLAQCPLSSMLASLKLKSQEVKVYII